METNTNNQVQKKYSDAEKKSINEALKTLSKNFNLGVSLSVKERRQLPSVAKERMPFIQLGLKAVKNYPEVLPRDFDEKGLEDDVVLTEYLHDVLLKLNDVKKKIEDVFIMAGAESLKNTKMIRSILKARQKSDPDYGNIIEEMDAFFKRTKTKNRNGESQEEPQIEEVK